MRIQKNNFLFLTITLLIICVGAVFFRNNNLVNKDNSQLQVTTSFYPLYYFASQIGGEKTKVINITPPNAEPHDYEPTTGDMINIEESKLLIINGAGFEGWGESVRASLRNKGVKIIEAATDIANKKNDEDGIVAQDPHVWLDPILARKQVEKILDAYKEVDPLNASVYQKNADNLFKMLDELNKEFLIGLKICKGRDIVTSHAAFGYLAARYSLNQIAISGFSPDSEPSPRKIAEVSGLVKKYNIKYIFFENLVSPSIANTIAAETNATTILFDPIEGLTDERIKNGEDYMSLQRQNLANLKIALSCQ